MSDDRADLLTLVEQVIAVWECEHAQCAIHGNHLLVAAELISKAIASAVAEERERCARIAEAYQPDAISPTEERAGERRAAWRIAAAIREG